MCFVSCFKLPKIYPGKAKKVGQKLLNTFQSYYVLHAHHAVFVISQYVALIFQMYVNGDLKVIFNCVKCKQQMCQKSGSDFFFLVCLQGRWGLYQFCVLLVLCLSVSCSYTFKKSLINRRRFIGVTLRGKRFETSLEAANHLNALPRLWLIPLLLENFNVILNIYHL